MQFLLIILKLNSLYISGELGRRSSTVFGFLMPCWYSYPYHNNRYIFGHGDITCLSSSKRTLKPSKTKYPLGKHANNLMPYKSTPGMGSEPVIQSSSVPAGYAINSQSVTRLGCGGGAYLFYLLSIPVIVFYQVQGWSAVSGRLVEFNACHQTITSQTALLDARTQELTADRPTVQQHTRWPLRADGRPYLPHVLVWQR